MKNDWFKQGRTCHYLKSSGFMTTNQWIGRCYVNVSGKWDKTR